MEFATLLMPISAVPTEIGVLQRINAKQTGTLVQAYQYSTARSMDYFFCSHKSGKWQCGPWASDARFLFASTKSGILVRFVICDGSYLERGGEKLFFSKARVIRDEWLLDAPVPGMVSDPVTAIPSQSLLHTEGDGSGAQSARMKLRVQ
jgi:hypothetical protein